MAVLNKPKVKKVKKAHAVTPVQPALPNGTPNLRAAKAPDTSLKPHSPFGASSNQEFGADLSEPLTIAKMAQLQRQFIASLGATEEEPSVDVPQDDSWTA